MVVSRLAGVLMARATAFSRDLQLMVDKTLSPQARSRMIADAARGALADAQRQNQSALGVLPEHETFVDSRRGAPLESVNPDRGVIVFEFQINLDLFEYIGRMLVLNSPVLTGEYQRSHRLYADGVEVDRYDPKMAAAEWVFTTGVPYARRIEGGSSDMAPNGVYEAVAAMAAKRYGNIAAIKFSFRDVIGGTRGAAARAARQPAIVVRIL